MLRASHPAKLLICSFCGFVLSKILLCLQGKVDVSVRINIKKGHHCICLSNNHRVEQSRKKVSNRVEKRLPIFFYFLTNVSYFPISESHLPLDTLQAQKRMTPYANWILVIQTGDFLCRFQPFYGLFI